MIEAELKAVVREPDTVLRRLEDAYGPGRAEVYRDTYYDTAGGRLSATDRELRIRELPAALAAVRAVLAGLGVPEGDLTVEPYTAAVAAARLRPPRP
ncbi:CYTH domain-containing protein [Kitasatospora sp. NPDC057541]|uniref:CYTH domain-containing protein n=1 Tax=unclassified Kitasatospora TaxID=2633591 RepID=UPI0036C68065